MEGGGVEGPGQAGEGGGAGVPVEEDLEIVLRGAVCSVAGFLVEEDAYGDSHEGFDARRGRERAGIFLFGEGLSLAWGLWNQTAEENRHARKPEFRYG